MKTFSKLYDPRGISGLCILVMCFAHGVYARTLPPTLNEFMVVLPGGTFEQGSPDSEPRHQDREGPVHKVHLQTFALGRFEVTVAQFRTFVEQTGYLTDAERDVPAFGQAAPGCFSHQQAGKPSAGWVAGRSWRDPGFAQADTHPVVCVSWNDASAYVAWLRDQTGLNYRLPTESEFEYAQRAGKRTPYAWPDDSELCVRANHGDKSLRSVLPDLKSETTSCNDGHAFSAPVGNYEPNAFGLHDIVGNVSEWTEDCWHETYQDAPSDGRSWEASAKAECRGRVLRGGDFMSPTAQLRSANRTWIPESFRTYHVGFRVALEQ
ncbi:formylglycine-generating enzyme family protein [Microbulbifer sp. SAOS-129_SWC]|uniref:formylglycine-generating enzyme family protein n=1 Tax=Microbulbifer sp. SAOS-129_SWC TaxID=3145235 RepID=UPI003217D739